MSGIEVIGCISAVISIIDASIKIFESARKEKLPETFEAVGRRLPIILDTLQTCKNDLEPSKGSMPTDVCEALEKILDTCDEKAGKLRGVFEKVLPGETDTWKKRYSKAIRRLGEGSKVEELMISITQDVQLIVNNHAVKSAKPEENVELEDIIKEMESLETSVPEEESPAPTFSSGGGSQTNNVNRGSGQQINNNAAVRTQNFRSVTIERKKDFRFQGAVGKCLGQAPDIGAELFVGRDSQLNEMKKVLKPGDESRERRLLVLGGMGGIGKTQLAIAYANRHNGDYKSIFWLNALSTATIKDGFQSLARLIFGIQNIEGLEAEQVMIEVQRWLSSSKNKEWLLILDNYDDPSQFKIEEYYPPASQGAIIVTTRLPDLVAGTTILIRSLQNIEESLTILQTRSKRENVKSDPSAERLAERLGGLPLALVTAGAYLRKSVFTFDRYLQEYEKRWNIDPRRPPQLQEYQDRTLYTTWDLSYTILQRDDPDAAKLLKLLAYFDNQNIWYQLVHAGLTDSTPDWLRELVTDDVCFDSMMGTLTDYCFLESRTEQQSWSMHTCVHDWTLAALNKDIDAQHYWYAFDCVAGSINWDDIDSFGHLSYSHLAAHAKRLEQQHFYQNNLIDNIATDRLDKASYIAQVLQDQVQLVAAEKMCQRVLQGYETALGADHTSILDTVNNLGNLYFNQGKLAEVKKMY